MTKRQQILRSLESEEYRREFAADVGTSLAIQIRLLREKLGWTQEDLAQRMGKRQETISQWENPDYGRYTLNTLKELASAYDVALLVRFAPFSDLVDWIANLTPQRLAPPSFAEELRGVGNQMAGPQEDSTRTQVAGATFPYQESLFSTILDENLRQAIEHKAAPTLVPTTSVVSVTLIPERMYDAA
jgi:transcriptional regulator with XRE-family HTH domain